MSRAILVSGATGRQGGSVVRALLALNPPDVRILALTRDPTSSSAQKLAAKSDNISLIKGDLDSPDAIFEDAKKVAPSIWGVFSVQTLAMGKEATINEEKQGKALVDAALKNGVQHFVYASVDRGGERSLDNETDIPHFASKHRIEKHLIAAAEGSGMSWTILRPVAFMENLDGGFVGKVFATAWRLVVRSRPLQLIAVDDIGVFAAKAFTSPEEFKGRGISLAGDELTYEQMEEQYREVMGSPVPTTFGIVARMVLRMSREMGNMFAFFEREGYAADIPELRKMYPDLKDLKTWLAEQKQA